MNISLSTIRLLETIMNIILGLTLSSHVVDSGCGRGLSRCDSRDAGSSVLFLTTGVARGDKSKGNYNISHKSQ